MDTAGELEGLCQDSLLRPLLCAQLPITQFSCTHAPVQERLGLGFAQRCVSSSGQLCSPFLGTRPTAGQCRQQRFMRSPVGFGVRWFRG